MKKVTREFLNRKRARKTFFINRWKNSHQETQKEDWERKRTKIPREYQDIQDKYR